MIKVRYVGVMFPQREFETLRAAYQHLRALQRQRRPMGPDYLVLGEALNALKQAAVHFTKDEYFYGGRPH